MKKKLFIIANVLLLFGAIFLTGCEKNIDSKVTNQLTHAKISFEHFYIDAKEGQVLLQEWDYFLDKNMIAVSQIEIDIETKNNEFLYGGGKVFEDDNYPKNLSTAISLHSGFVIGDDHVISSLKRQIDNLSGILVTERTSQQSELLESLLQQLDAYTDPSNKIKVKSIMIIVPQNVLNDLNEFINRSDGSMQLLDDFLSDLRNNSLNQMSTRDATSWTPDYGTIETYATSSTKRTVINHFTWTTKPFTSQWYTYEHDFFLNNYANSSLPGTYLSRAINSSGFPICDWYSNLPYKYLDTRLFDENNAQGTSQEVPYTIGCGDAYSLAKNQDYWTQIITNYGDANSDNAKLFAQKGTQIPTGCTSVWCSFATQNKTILPAWTISVPGSLSWTL